MKINGIEIFVERLKGNGSFNFVLLHNAGGSHQFFIHQIELLKKYGDVIWLDLPGHGESKGMASYQMSDLSLLVSQACQKISLNHICLMGLNNGADIVLDITLNHSLPIKKIILIDPPLFMEKTFIGEINAFINQLEQADYSKFVSSLVDALFVHTNDLNKKIAEQAFNNVDRKAL